MLPSIGDVNPLELELSDAESEIASKLLETFRGTSASWGGNRARFSFWISEFRDFENDDVRRATLLSLWMSKCVFNTTPVQFVKPFTFPLAVVLCRGASLPLGSLCLGTLYSELDRLHSDVLEGSPYHIIESSINVVLLQTFMWGHSKDYAGVGKDVGDVKASNWVIGPAGPDGELQFLGFEDGLPLLMKWMGLKVWNLPSITLLDDGGHFAWKPYSYVAAGFQCPNPFLSSRPGSQEFGLNENEKIPNLLLITSPSFIPYLRGDGFGLTQYNLHKVMRQFGFDQDVPNINTTVFALSDAVQPLVHGIALKYWANRIERILVLSRHREGYATPSMKLYWQKVMSNFEGYVKSREVNKVVIGPPLRELSSNAQVIPNTKAASTWAARQNLGFAEWKADLNGWVVHGGDIPMEWSEKNIIAKALESNPATGAPKRPRGKSPSSEDKPRKVR